MNLEDVQQSVSDLLGDIAEFDDKSVVVLIDDGTYPKLQGREAELQRKGLVLVVSTLFDPVIVGEQAKDGAGMLEVTLGVSVEEDVAINRGTTGTGISVEKAVRLIMSGCSGKPATIRPPKYGFLLADPPFIEFGVEAGVRQMFVQFKIRVAV